MFFNFEFLFLIVLFGMLIGLPFGLVLYALYLKQNDPEKFDRLFFKSGPAPPGYHDDDLED